MVRAEIEPGTGACEYQQVESEPGEPDCCKDACSSDSCRCCISAVVFVISFIFLLLFFSRQEWVGGMGG
jgi:hypothetical protein